VGSVRFGAIRLQHRAPCLHAYRAMHFLRRVEEGRASRPLWASIRASTARPRRSRGGFSPLPLWRGFSCWRCYARRTRLRKPIGVAKSGSVTPPEDRQACLSGAGRGYFRAKREWRVAPPVGGIIYFKAQAIHIK
jgi:hypothetical protein